MNKEVSKRTATIVIITVLFVLVIPAILVVLSATWLGRSYMRPEIKEEVAAHVAPSEVVANKGEYRDDFLALRGQVIREETICERKECPPDDPCCGCPFERDLIIIDSGVSTITQTGGTLKLLTPEGDSFCHREGKSCQYDCLGWQPGAIYLVKGIFRATPPPQGTGLRIYFGYHFEVEEKELVRSLGIFEKARSLLNEVKDFISSSSTSGYYVLD